MGPKPPAPRASERTLEQTLALALWMGGYHLNVALLMAELYWSPHPVALACLAVHIASCIWPGLSDTPPAWGRRLAGTTHRGFGWERSRTCAMWS